MFAERLDDHDHRAPACRACDRHDHYLDHHPLGWLRSLLCSRCSSRNKPASNARSASFLSRFVWSLLAGAAMRILKSGGSSVGTPERVRATAAIIRRAQAERGPIAVVVSAFQGVTDQLLTLAERASRGDDYLPDLA